MVAAMEVAPPPPPPPPEGEVQPPLQPPRWGRALPLPLPWAGPAALDSASSLGAHSRTPFWPTSGESCHVPLGVPCDSAGDQITCRYLI